MYPYLTYFFSSSDGGLCDSYKYKNSERQRRRGGSIRKKKDESSNEMEKDKGKESAKGN